MADLHRLGDYIQEVDERNSNLEVMLSQGICNQKYFQTPRQVSVTPHLDKIVRTGQFAYNRATTRNGNKISIAYREGPDCTVSSAYCVFFITDENKLNPYYLWLWFKRQDFDRYAIFMSHGSAHEFFEYETMCNTMIPVPPIEKQREIVSNYLAIQNRIALNKQTISKLEEAAQAIYHNIFIEKLTSESFLNGWQKKKLCDILQIKYGKDYKQLSIGAIPLYGSGGIMGYVDRAIYTKPSVLVPRKGSLNNVLLVTEPFWTVDTMFYSSLYDDDMLYYAYMYLSAINFLSIGMGSAVPSMTSEYLSSLELIIPPHTIIKNFNNLIAPLFNHKKVLQKEIELLNKTLAQISDSL